MKTVRILFLVASTLFVFFLIHTIQYTVALTSPLWAATSKTLVQASGPTTATIALIGLPVEDTLDAAGYLVVSSGLENVAVETHVLLEGGGMGVQPEAVSAYSWTLQSPQGSTTVLSDPTSRYPTFIPDQAGTFVVGLSVADQQGDYGPTTYLTVTAGTWVGVGVFSDGASHPSQCINCHEDVVAAWQQTLHATSLIRAIDGQYGEYYFENCIYCHTVGYAQAADNGGFDDVARELGWTYPETLAEGNWNELVSNYPRLADLGNPQCENCHGPGSQESDDVNNVAVSLRPDLCIVCHDPLRQDRCPQWVGSSHSDTSITASDGLNGIDDPRCAACHTAEGAIAFWSGETVVGGGMEAVTCAVCHDPHEYTSEYQLRVFDTVSLPDGIQVRQVGSSALCMSCHNAVVGSEIVDDEMSFRSPHGGAAEMLTGTGGYDYGEVIYDSSHSNVNEVEWDSVCIDCHIGTHSVNIWLEQDIEAIATAMNNPVGGHTFGMRWDGEASDPSDDMENIAACEMCHKGISHINGPAADDYDGNGKVEGVQDEVQGLLDLVRAEIIATGVDWEDESLRWDSARTQEQRAAIYNWSFVARDRSLGIHNLGRSVQLLQITYRHLTGQDIPGAILWQDAHDTPPYAERFGLASKTVIIPSGTILLTFIVIYMVIRLRKR